MATKEAPPPVTHAILYLSKPHNGWFQLKKDIRDWLALPDGAQEVKKYIKVEETQSKEKPHFTFIGVDGKHQSYIFLDDQMILPQ